ncbi:MAG: hypothetical protein SFT68_03060 [Rickettsiaceae bacterium]|nr:hypothetical protein [Rickettsiaceae bacterium]
MTKRKYTNLPPLDGDIQISLINKGFSPDQINSIYNNDPSHFKEFVQLTQDESFNRLLEYNFDLESVTQISSHGTWNNLLYSLLESVRTKTLDSVMQKFTVAQITKILVSDGGYINFHVLNSIMRHDSELNNFITSKFRAGQITKILSHAEGGKNLSFYLDIVSNNLPGSTELTAQSDIKAITALLSKSGGSLVLEGLLDVITTKPEIWSKIKVFDSCQISKMLSIDSGYNNKLVILLNLIESNLDVWDRFILKKGTDNIALSFCNSDAQNLGNAIEEYRLKVLSEPIGNIDYSMSSDEEDTNIRATLETRGGSPEDAAPQDNIPEIPMDIEESKVYAIASSPEDDHEIGIVEQEEVPTETKTIIDQDLIPKSTAEEIDSLTKNCGFSSEQIAYIKNYKFKYVKSRTIFTNNLLTFSCNNRLSILINNFNIHQIISILSESLTDDSKLSLLICIYTSEQDGLKELRSKFSADTFFKITQSYGGFKSLQALIDLYKDNRYPEVKEQLNDKIATKILAKRAGYKNLEEFIELYTNQTDAAKFVRSQLNVVYIAQILAFCGGHLNLNTLLDIYEIRDKPNIKKIIDLVSPHSISKLDGALRSYRLSYHEKTSEAEQDANTEDLQNTTSGLAKFEYFLRKPINPIEETKEYESSEDKPSDASQEDISTQDSTNPKKSRHNDSEHDSQMEVTEPQDDNTPNEGAIEEIPERDILGEQSTA